jgi:hypothetical protein
MLLVLCRDGGRQLGLTERFLGEGLECEALLS